MKRVQELEREPLRELYKPKNIFQNAGSKVFYNSTLFENTADNRGGAAKWTLVAPTFQADMAGEINRIVYLEKTKIPDYEMTLKMLKRLGQTRAYPDQTMSDALIRLATYFEGYHPSVFDKMSAYEIA